MNWFLLAENDFRINQDPERIRQFVVKEKITAEQFTEITSLPYEEVTP